MPIESTTTISGLDSSYPLGSDALSQGDNHLRLIKAVLKAQFPGTGGSGFSTAILADETELNYLQGLTSNAQDQFDALGLRVDALEATLAAPTGTKMAFFQAAAPTGWTQDVSNNDAMLRVVSTAGGGTGGTDSAILMDKIPTHTHTFSATTSTTGAHTHSFGGGWAAVYNAAAVAQADMNGSEVCARYYNTDSDGNHDHSVSGTSAANSGGGNWTPKYVDMIIATKD